MKKIPEGFEIAPYDHVMRAYIDIGTRCLYSHSTVDLKGKEAPTGFEWANPIGWHGMKVGDIITIGRVFCRPIVKKPKKAIINYPDGQTISVEIPDGWNIVFNNANKSKLTKRGDKYYIPSSKAFFPATYKRTNDKVSSYALVIRRSHKKKA